MKYIDIPKYRIRPKPERFLVDKIIILLGLGLLLYLGIYINYYLLVQTIPEYFNWIFIIGIILLCIIELIVCYIRYSKYIYTFYDKRIVISNYKNTEIYYSEIKTVNYTRNIIDKWIKTGSIIIELKNEKKIKLKYLDNPNQAYMLIQKNSNK